MQTQAFYDFFDGNVALFINQLFDGIEILFLNVLVLAAEEESCRKSARMTMGQPIRLESIVKEKLTEIAALRRELSEVKSLRGRLSAAKVEVENRELRRENQALREENRGLRARLAELGVGFLDREQRKSPPFPLDIFPIAE